MQVGLFISSKSLNINSLSINRNPAQNETFVLRFRATLLHHSMHSFKHVRIQSKGKWPAGNQRVVASEKG